MEPLGYGWEQWNLANQQVIIEDFMVRVTLATFGIKREKMPGNKMKKKLVIGTPLSPSGTKVMLLGSGELGKEVIIALQRLGIETIAVDRYENAPGQQVAHRAHVINMADGQQLRQVIELEKPDLIVPEIEAIATDTLMELEEEGWQVIPTARATRLTMDREGIRRLAAEELALPTSPYQFAESLEEVKAATHKIGLPCIIKPVMSSSGKGQSRIDNEEQMATAWNYAISAGRVNSGKVIVEGVIQFDYEITVLTVRALDKTDEINTYFCEPIGHRQVHGDYVESWQPQVMTNAAKEKAQEIARKITDSLGGLGIFGVELFIKGDEVYFSEVSPRPHDTGMVTMCTQSQNEFELHARAILGLPVDVSNRSPGASAVIYGLIAEKGVAFIGVDEALQVPNSDIRLFGKPESVLPHRRMGVALAIGRDTDEARARAKLAASKVKVVKSL